VLGGLGFIGSHLSRALVRQGFSVRIFDKLYASRELIRDFETSVEVIEGDMERPQDVLDALSGSEICFHLIYSTVPGSSMEDPGYDVQSNVVSSVRWLSQLHRTTIKRLIFVSSGGTVYGIPQSNPTTEDHPTNPISSYGISKLCVEKYVLLYGQVYGIAPTILRPSNVYGEGQKLNVNQGLIGVFANRILKGEPIEIWGDGTVRRDYLYIEDIISGLLRLLEYRGSYTVFNISAGEGHSVLEVVNLLGKIIGKEPQIIFKPARGFDVPVNILSSRRFAEETGWMPQTALREGISRFVKWLKNSGDFEDQYVCL
jgi:UDP-glucose 4-epimerase